MKKLSDKEFLVIELRHIYLRCAIIRKSGGFHTIADEERRVAFDPQRGVAAALETLSVRRPLPRQTVVVTTEALSALPEIEVPEDISPAEVREMLRWEMDDILAPNLSPPDVGKILADEELFPEKERAQILAHPDTASRQQTAIDAGLINDNDLQLLQDRLSDWPRSSEDFEFHLTDPKAKSPVLAKAGNTLVTCLPSATRLAWESICDANDTALFAIVPWSLAPLGMLPADAKRAGSEAIAASAVHHIYATFFERGEISEISVLHDFPEELQDAIIDHDVTAALLSGGVAGTVSDINEALAARGERKLLSKMRVRPEAAEVSQSDFAILGAAAFASGKASVTIPLVDTTPPPIPFKNRPSIWWATAAAIILPILVSPVFGKMSEKRDLTARFSVIQEKLAVLDGKEKVRNAQSREHKKIVSEVKRLENEVKQKTGTRYSEASLRYTDPNFHIALLGAVSEKFSNYAVLDSLQADFNGRVVLSGRSEREELIRYGLREFYKAVEEWGIEVERATTAYDQNSNLPYRFSTSKRGSVSKISAR